jgi:hypothetical protein
VLKVRLDRLVLKDRLAHKVFKAYREILVQLERQAMSVLLEHKVFRE